MEGTQALGHFCLQHAIKETICTDRSRLTLTQKLAVSATPEAILKKELALAGYQRPVDPAMMPRSARRFFQVGEFVGWIIQADER